MNLKKLRLRQKEDGSYYFYDTENELPYRIATELEVQLWNSNGYKISKETSEYACFHASRTTEILFLARIDTPEDELQNMAYAFIEKEIEDSNPIIDSPIEIAETIPNQWSEKSLVWASNETIGELGDITAREALRINREAKE